jgi:hypothetical protein
MVYDATYFHKEGCLLNLMDANDQTYSCSQVDEEGVFSRGLSLVPESEAARIKPPCSLPRMGNASLCERCGGYGLRRGCSCVYITSSMRGCAGGVVLVQDHAGEGEVDRGVSQLGGQA